MYFPDILAVVISRRIFKVFAVLSPSHVLIMIALCILSYILHCFFYLQRIEKKST